MIGSGNRGLKAGMMSNAHQREREWQYRRNEIREMEWAISKKLIAKAEQMLAIDLELAKWTLNTPGYLSEVGSRLTRQSAELTQSI